MSRFGQNSFLLLLLIFVSSTPFAFSQSDDPLKGLVDGNKNGGSIDFSAKVFAVGHASSNSTVLVLAADRTHRKDPTNGFNYYTKGWDIRNSHYMMSLAFSAAPLFIIAVVWFVFFGLFLCLMWVCCCCCWCCRGKKKVGYSQVAYAVSLTLLVAFTVAAIIGSVFLFTGQEKFHTTIMNIVKFIMQLARDLVQSLQNLADSLAGAKDLSVGALGLSKELRAQIDGMHGQLGNMTGIFIKGTGETTKQIHHFLDPMRINLICLNSFMLLLAFLGLLFSILGWQCLISVLTVIAWLAVVVTFILSGMFLLIHNAVADTCVALDDYLQNPTANSAMENFIPRADEKVTRAILKGTKGVTFGLVNTTNTAIVTIYNANLPPDAGPLYYNQSGPLMPILCNPFDLDLHDRQCQPGEVDFIKAPEVWRNYVCQVSTSGNCITPGRLTPTIYSNLTGSLNMSTVLYNYGPFLVELMDSTYLKRTLANFTSNYCPGLKKYSEWTYAGFTVVSASVLLSVILWIVHVRERSHRKYAKKQAKKKSRMMGGENPFAGGKKW